MKCEQCHPGGALPKVEACAGCHRERKTLEIGKLPYRVPDFVFFRHEKHKMECATCHGDVWRDEFDKPAVPAKMMGCVNCHKAKGAKTECTACHELSQ
jgi:hypothetical protein